ncbi:50S ribosomal protein L13 [candidate division WWE3 bacterium RIFCSPHIGHO2_01_FULL_48_15]|uniref:Large ribosomal subunit protein uL13 n=1 Tax=candidate division WWE3 bacterium RIFCSPHIGHO2_01_FULL_48_15 TaxID=1802619 RepID=A0A1F4VA07_UNCKA|nr:MAG: 50S ribosomal protein L13 [candidate division WWE3 bacterium RIFCSPHIGHO2_01_FULL_48_15]
MQKSHATKASEVKRDWHLLDAKGQILGRFSTQVAIFLLGKNKTNWVPYLDMGDYVVVVNAKDIKVTGKKETDKIYYRYTGYPGGLRKESLGHLRSRRPEEILRRSVVGMLPRGKLGQAMVKKLYVYPGPEGEMVEKAKGAQNG